MSTTLRFLIDDCDEIVATVSSVLAAGAFELDHRPSVVLSETNLQYEQPDRLSDQGWMDGQQIVAVHRLHNGDVAHHFDGNETAFRVGDRVRVRLDRERREVQSRLLCAGRLIQFIGPQVVAGFTVVDSDFRPHRGKIEFCHPEYIPQSDSIADSFDAALCKLLNSDLPVTMSPLADGPFAYVMIGNCIRFKCTSAYPKSVRDVGPIRIRRLVAIGGRLQVRFGLG